MSDPALESIEGLAPRIRAGRLSPVELLDAVLARVEAAEPVLHAYVTLDREAARAAAREAEREIRAGDWRGPLHGIPVALKDNIAVAGWPTTNGSPLMQGRVTDYDAAAVERLRAAGAIVLGKTALHEWAMGGTCSRQPGGPVRNPWDPERVPGGSSGGSAAAVAAGMASAAIGTDGMGSIRTPASYCGVVGLKPTPGRTSRFGVLPATSSPNDQLGSLTRTVGDARILLEVLSGPDPRDPTSRRRPDDLDGKDEANEGSELRVGIVRSPLLDDVRPEVREVVATAAADLVAAGGRLEEVELRTLAQAPLAVAGVLTELQAALLPLALHHPDGFANPEIRFRVLAAEFIGAADVRRARQLANRVRAEVAEAFRRVDVLLLPTNTTTAFPIEASEVLVGEGISVDLRRPGGQGRITTRLTLPFNVAGVPAISVPGDPLVEGLPVGIQLIAPPWRDERLLRVAGRLEAAARARRGSEESAPPPRSAPPRFVY